MIRRPISQRLGIILQVVSVLLIIGIYSFLSWRQHVINPIDKTIPTLHQFVDGWKTLCSPDSSKRYWLIDDFSRSGQRFGLGMLAGVSAAFLIGILMGVYPIIEAFCRWPVRIMGSVPPTAMLAIYFVVFGIELKMYIAMIAFGIFPGLAMSIYRAVITDVSEHAISKAYTLGSDSLEVITSVVLQQILPRIIEFVRIAVGPALIFLIAAEWANADVGFGYRLKLQSRLQNMNVVYTYLAILAITTSLIDYYLLILRKRLCGWFEKETL